MDPAFYRTKKTVPQRSTSTSLSSRQTKGASDWLYLAALATLKWPERPTRQVQDQGSPPNRPFRRTQITLKPKLFLQIPEGPGTSFSHGFGGEFVLPENGCCRGLWQDIRETDGVLEPYKGSLYIHVIQVATCEHIPLPPSVPKERSRNAGPPGPPGQPTLHLVVLAP